LNKNNEVRRSNQQQLLPIVHSSSVETEVYVSTNSVLTDTVVDNDNDNTYNLTREDYLEFCERIGLSNHLKQLFNTKQTKTNSKESNAIDAEKRSSTALSRTFHFIQESLQYVESWTDSNEKIATNLKPQDHSVEGVFVHVMNHFQFFLDKQLEHLSILQRAPATIKVVMQDYDEIFLNYFLMSDTAASILPETTVSCIIGVLPMLGTLTYCLFNLL
jgi:hypothetical protein